MKQQLNLQYPCTTIHVRRGDAGIPTTPYRRYAAVQEYLDAGNVEEGSNVFLMTDDDSTLTEIQKHLKDKYNWIYFKKPRNQGIVAGFDKHIPSGDEALEMVTIASEQQLAASCQNFVHGQSGFVKSLLEEMDFDRKNVTVHYLDTEVTKEEAVQYKADQQGRVTKFLQDIEDLYQRRAQERKRELAPSATAASPTVKTSTSITETDTSNAPVVLDSIATTSELPDQTISELKCQTSEGEQCCVGWDKNVDSWWTHHPTWEISALTETSQCFQPIKNAEKATYLQQVYDNQWKGNCDNVTRSTQINSGYSAATNWLAYAFRYATMEGKPFQISRHDFPWLFGPQSESSWAYCSSQDITCFILPLSKCERDFVPKKELGSYNNDRKWSQPSHDQKEKKVFNWLKQYMMRPNQEMRRQLMVMRQPLKLTPPCTTMHVRRADSGMPERPYRRYASVQEYLDVGKVEEGETILLLTDDQTTIDEINTYHPNFNWVYLNRTRHSGVDGGWQSHLPSGDGPFEVGLCCAVTLILGQRLTPHAISSRFHL